MSFVLFKKKDKKKRLKLVFDRSVVKCEQLHVVLVQGHNHNVM